MYMKLKVRQGRLTWHLNRPNSLTFMKKGCVIKCFLESSDLIPSIFTHGYTLKSPPLSTDKLNNSRKPSQEIFKTFIEFLSSR